VLARYTKREIVAMRCLTSLALSLTMLLAAPARADEVVNIYSYRQPQLIQPLLDRFTAETGIATQVLFDDKGTIERLAQEGINSPADMVLTADVIHLVEMKERGLAQPVHSAVLDAAIPANFRDPDSQWFGLTMRGRVIYASRDRVKQETMSYDDLADPRWKGKVCIRSGQHIYNLALFAGIIAHKGEDGARRWLEGLKANLARKPAGNDRQQAQAIYGGECDLALGNTYYVGKMMTNDKEPAQKDWARAIRVIFPVSPEMGTHANISGAAIAAHAPHAAAAIKLLEFLAGEEAQRIYAEQNFEYPVRPGVAASELVRSWGPITPDDLPLGEIARYAPLASKLVDEVQLND
jgi:iron(III) transport system substrate-binding protein